MVDDEPTWLLVGENGAKNGEKRLRRLLTRTSQWADAEARQATVRGPTATQRQDVHDAAGPPPRAFFLCRRRSPVAYRLQALKVEHVARMDVLARVLRGEANCGDLRKARTPRSRRGCMRLVPHVLR